MPLGLLPDLQACETERSWLRADRAGQVTMLFHAGNTQRPYPCDSEGSKVVLSLRLVNKLPFPKQLKHSWVVFAIEENDEDRANKPAIAACASAFCVNKPPLEVIF